MNASVADFKCALGQLESQGYVEIPELLSAPQVAEVAAWLRDIVARGAAVSSALEPEFERTGPTEEPTLRKIRRLFWNDQTFWISLFKRSKILAAAQDMVGPSASLIFHAAFMKPALVGSAVEPHQDQALWGIPYPGAVTLWVAIDPATPENGCLQMFEGSHHRGLISHDVFGEQNWHAGVNTEANGLRPRQLPMRPGDAVAWHRYMLHASSANRSPANRWGMVMVFADSSHPQFDSYDRFLMSLLRFMPPGMAGEQLAGNGLQTRYA
jgi:ectoine hydroxylase-related dioxygenase (phytanoyl-CoA dioxygenase family)